MERRERAGRDARDAIEGEMATRFTGGMAEEEGDVVRRRGGDQGGSGVMAALEVWLSDDMAALELSPACRHVWPRLVRTHI